jgi:hypothetical protein
MIGSRATAHTTPSPPKQGKRPKTSATVDLTVEETPRRAAAPAAGSSRASGARVAQAAQSSGTRVAETSAAASAPRAGPSGTRRSTRVRGVVASAPVASGSGETDRDDYRPGGLNVDYEDLFAEARRSSSRSLHTRAHVLQQAMIRVSFMERNLRAR